MGPRRTEGESYAEENRQGADSCHCFWSVWLIVNMVEDCLGHRMYPALEAARFWYRETLLGGGIALGILEAVIGVKCIIRKRLRQSDEERVENG